MKERLKLENKLDETLSHWQVRGGDFLKFAKPHQENQP